MVTNQYENTIIELENIIRDLRKCQPSYESLLASMYPHMPKVYSIITSIPENDKDRIYAQYPDFEFFFTTTHRSCRRYSRWHNKSAKINI